MAVHFHNDLISAKDHGNLGALVTLDFSSAFDTVDHQTFLSILQQRFGVADSALNWFKSYLSDPFTVWRIRYCCSSDFSPSRFLSRSKDLHCLPKKEIDAVFLTHKFSHHCFADDTQTYLDVPQSQVGAVALRIQDCLKVVAD